MEESTSIKNDEELMNQHLSKLNKEIINYLRMIKQFERHLAVLSKVQKKTPTKFVKKYLLPAWEQTVSKYIKNNVEGFLSEKEKINFSYGLFIVNGSEKKEYIEKKELIIEQTIIEILLKCIEKEKRRNKVN